MPKKSKDKDKKSKKKKAAEDIYTKPLMALQRTYYNEFTKATVDPIESVRRGIRACLEAEKGPKPLETLIIEPPAQTAKPKANAVDDDEFFGQRPPPLYGVSLSSCIPALCNAIRIQNFTMIKQIDFWGFSMSLDSATTFANLLDSMSYPITTLEFSDCNLCPESIARIGLALPKCELLTSVSFDYNGISLDGLGKLLKSISKCRKLLDLSLCYCDLDFRSGKILGQFVSNSVLRNLYLDGNDLELGGISDFFGELTASFKNIDHQLEIIAAAEAAAAAAVGESLDIDGAVISVTGNQMLSTPVTPEKPLSASLDKPKRKKRKRSRSKKRSKKLDDVIPPSGPWLRKLHLADTFGGFAQMEHYTVTKNSAPSNYTKSQSLDCMSLTKQIAAYIIRCEELEELDLYNNWLGYGAGILILEALQKRAAAEKPAIGLKVNRGIDGQYLKKIFKIASGVKKKKKKRKKSAKKK